MKITINDIPFGSKKEALEYCRTLRSKYDIGERIVDADHFFLFDLLSHHKGCVEKIGCGIEYFTVEIDKQFKGKHFMIHRLDGSVIDFSFDACLRHRTESYGLRWAARREITSQIFEYKDNVLKLNPDLPTNWHVHHLPPAFAVILARFLDIYGYSANDIKLEDKGSDIAFADRKIASEWQDYHRQNAKLDYISEEEHKIETLKDRSCT